MHFSFFLFQSGRTLPAAIEMKIGSSIENRLWILNMTMHINSINQHLQSRVIDMMRHRLRGDDAMVNHPRRGRAKTDDDLQENLDPIT